MEGENRFKIMLIKFVFKQKNMHSKCLITCAYLKCFWRENVTKSC